MLDIFATDPEAARAREEREAKRQAARQARPTYDFQFRSGKREGRLPVSLRKWRITTPTDSTAERLCGLLGGTLSHLPNGDLAVDTDHDSIEVVVYPKKIEAKLVQWADGLPIHECDGRVSLLPDDNGQPCGCPPLVEEKKERAKQRRGPKPNIVIPFRLVHGLHLGLGKYTATAWSFAEDLPYIMRELEAIGTDEVLCKLRLEHIEWTTNAGEKRDFVKPVLEPIGPFNSAAAGDEPEPDF